jgi:hypothetical protein
MQPYYEEGKWRINSSPTCASRWHFIEHMHLDRAHHLRPMYLTWNWAKTCAKVFHILGLAHMRIGQTSGANKTWIQLLIAWRTLVSGATDVGLGSDGRWHQLLVAYFCSCTAEGGKRRGVVEATDASVKALRVGSLLDFVHRATDERQMHSLRSDGRVCWCENDHWKFDCTGHMAASWAMDTGCRVCCVATDASIDPVFLNNGSIRRGSSIFLCWPALGLLSWNFDILVSILS